MAQPQFVFDRFGNVLRQELTGLGDTALTMGKNMVMQPAAGYAGLFDLMRGRGLDSAVNTIDSTQAIAGGPSTPEGTRNLQAVGDTMGLLTEPLTEYVVDPLGEVSPAAAAGLLGLAAVVDPAKGVGRVGKLGKLSAKAATGGERALTGALRPGLDPVRGQTSNELKAMQRRDLSAQEQDALAGYRQRYSDFADASSFMTPQELGKVVGSESNVRKVDELLRTLPHANEMASLAKAGAPKQGWYRASTQALIDVFGHDDAPRFASLLAAMSPQTSVEMNLSNTLKTWKNWIAAGRPTDEKSIRAILGSSVAGTKGEGSVLEAWAQNAHRSLSAADPLKVTLSGPKVDSFYHNLADDVYRVTNDAWIANGLGVDQGLFSGSPTSLQLSRGDPGLTPGYIATNARIRQGAQKAGMFPSEGQETVWSLAMPLYESQSRLGLPAREILDRGLLTPDVIRGTPDFSTLLNQGQNAKILEQAGYGDQLAALRPHQWPEASVDLSLADQRNVDKMARRLEELQSNRALESRAIRVPVSSPTPPSTAFAYATPEMIPGEGIGHLPGLLYDTPGARQNFTSRAGSAFKDVQGRDVLRQAVGHNPLQTRSMTGAFRPDGEVPFVGARKPIEVQPGFGIGSEVQVVGGAKNPTIPERVQRELTAVEALRGAMTGQHGSPWNVQIPMAGGESLFFPMDKKVNPDNMGLAAVMTNGEFPLADTGAGTALINFGGRPLAQLERDQIGGWLGASQQPYPSRNVSDYVDYSQEWRAPPGSGAVTRKMLGYVDQLPQGKQAALSDASMKPADSLHDLYTSVGASRNEPTRDDLMLLLDIMRKQGLQGVRGALNSGAALPVAAGAMIAPGLLQYEQGRD